MARLQRNDLAKEFSEIVQQEIINHNEMILVSNQSINLLRDHLQEIKDIFYKKNAGFQCDLVELSSDISRIKERCELSVAKLQRDVNDSSAHTLECLKSMKKSMDERESYFMRVEGFEQFKSSLNQWVANIERSFHVQKDSLKDQVDRVSEGLKLSISMLKEHLNEVIKKEAIERETHNRQLDVFSINFAGNKQELEHCKKRCFIIEKNIENLYTQIERLRADK